MTRQLRLHDAILASNEGNPTPDVNTENMAKLNEAIEGAEVDPDTNDKEQLRQFYTAPTDHELAMARDMLAHGVKAPTHANQSLLCLLASLLSAGRNNLSASRESLHADNAHVCLTRFFFHSLLPALTGQCTEGSSGLFGVIRVSDSVFSPQICYGPTHTHLAGGWIFLRILQITAEHTGSRV